MMEPAPLEHLSILRAKSGADVDKEVYAFKDKGGRDIGLRFDLTVGMTRFVCGRKDLRPPIKLASLAGAWRYDEPQHARYRWFKQWDMEIFGPPSIESDAEVIEATCTLFEKLGLQRVTVQIGDRGTVQRFIHGVLNIRDDAKAVELMRALDHVQRTARSDLLAEYSRRGYKNEDLAKLFEFGSIRGPPEKVLEELGKQQLEAPALEALADAMRGRGVEAEFNLGVVRGIDYYTGVVFEVVDSAHPESGSLAGGGRYDLLPTAFGRPDLSATGAAGGMERIALSLPKEAGHGRTLVYVAVAGLRGSREESRRILRKLRERGFPAESALLQRPLSKQLEDASRAGASWVLILGEREVKSGRVTLRNMADRSEEFIPIDSALSRIAGP